MPDKKAIERGLEFEDYVAKLLDGKTQPGSGNKFHSPLDVDAHGLLISCKSEQNLTWGKINKHLDETIEKANGTGKIPVLAIERVDGETGVIDFLPNEQLVVMKLSHFARAFQDEISIPKNTASPGEEKRATAEIPLLLRQ